MAGGRCDALTGRRKTVETDLHGQSVSVPADAVALRYPEDVHPADNEFIQESNYGLVGCLHEELAEEGPPALMSGLAPRIAKIGLGQAVIFCSYEQATRLAMHILDEQR